MSEKVGTEIELTSDDYYYNMFEKPLNKRYASKFHEVYYSNILERDTKMKELYEESQKDESLNEKQKLLIKKCYIAYRFAVGDRCKFSVPIVAYVDKKKPNLSKFLNSTTRVKRLYYDLYDKVAKTGFKFDVGNIMNFIRIFMVQFAFHNKNDLNSFDYYMEETVFAAISRFARLVSSSDIGNIWYILILMKNIASYAYMRSGIYEENDFLKPQVASILTTFDMIVALEHKRLYGKPKQEGPSEKPLPNNENASSDIIVETTEGGSPNELQLSTTSSTTDAVS